MQNVIHVMTGDLKGVDMIIHVLLLFKCFKSNQIHVKLRLWGIHNHNEM